MPARTLDAAVPWVRLVRDPDVPYGDRQENGERFPPVRDAQEAASLLAPKLAHQEVEVFAVLALDGKNRPLRRYEVSRGTLTAALVHPREVFRPAIALGAAALILAHNHPSGDPTPSCEDKAISERLRQVGELVGIRVLDHVIVADGARAFSMAEEGSW